MKSLMSKIISIVLVIVLIGTCCVFAADNIPKEENYSNNAIDAVFDGNGKVYKGETEITEIFIRRFEDLYLEKDYDTIREIAANDGIDRIEALIVRGFDPQLHYSDYTEYSMHLITQNHAPFENKTWYFTVTASGYVEYYFTSDGSIIVNYPNPTFGFQIGSAGAMFHGEVISTTQSAITLNSAKTKINFSMYSIHEMFFGYEDLSISIGTYSDTANFEVIFR